MGKNRCYLYKNVTEELKYTTILKKAVIGHQRAATRQLLNKAKYANFEFSDVMDSTLTDQSI